jgi:two-component system sensor histidine kinase/response regulator
VDRPLRILIAEDNPTNQRLVALFLEGLEGELTMAANGREALDAATVSVFDVILMDMQMPVMDGLEATRLLRRSDGPNRRTPIIALTANAMQPEQDACVAAGMDGHVSKPINPAMLIEAVLTGGDMASSYRAAAYRRTPQPAPISTGGRRRRPECAVMIAWPSALSPCPITNRVGSLPILRRRRGQMKCLASRPCQPKLARDC